MWAGHFAQGFILENLQTSSLTLKNLQGWRPYSPSRQPDLLILGNVSGLSVKIDDCLTLTVKC